MKVDILRRLKKLNLETLFSWFIIVYFFLLVLPYCLAPLRQVYLFLDNQFVNISLRAVASLLMVSLSTLIYIKHKPPLNKPYLVLTGLLVVCLFLSSICTKPTFSSLITHNPYVYMTFVSYNVGSIEILGGIASCLIDLIFGYSFLFILPIVANNKTIKRFIMVVIVFVVFEILYSLVFEFDKYVATLSGGGSYGGYDIDIRATFISKNQFGAFLIMGFICSLLSLHLYSESKIWKAIFIACCIIISIISLLSLCKTAIMSLILFGIPYVFYLFASLFKKHKYKVLTIIGTSTAAFILFLIILSLTSLHSVPGFKQIYNLFSVTLANGFKIALEERIVTWAYSLQIFNGGHIVYGYPKATVYYALNIGTNGNNMYAHNGFIQQLLYYGLMGPIILFFSYYVIFKRIRQVGDVKMRIFYISVFFAVFSFMMTETEILTVSSSLLVFVFNIIYTTLKIDNHKQDIFERRMYEITI